MSVPRVILCVEDEPMALETRRLILTMAGYEVLTATDGETGLDVFLARPVDLVITDHMLPRCTGSQMANEMKQRKPRVPIVLFTGMPEELVDHTCFDLILAKGTNPVEFLAAIAEVLAQNSSD